MPDWIRPRRLMRSYQWLGVTVLALITLLGWQQEPHEAAAAPTASIALAPTSGPVGASVTVAGRSFPKRQAVQITFGGMPVTPSPAPSTGPNGAFSATVVVPAETSGQVAVVATVGGTSAGATFVVTTTPPPPPPGSDPVLVGAGDIAACGGGGDEATAALLDSIVAANANVTVFTAGDNVYDNGTATEFANCYAPSWGRHRARTRPATGNHDYLTAGAGGYFGYFGAAAGDPSKGYYSYDLGGWHIVVLNSNCGIVACGAGSAQEQWLRADLAAHPVTCTLAYWHHPRFSSGSTHGSSTATAAFWQALYDLGADVVIAGHDHLYERFALQAPSGTADPARGIRQFTVGTGGRSHYGFGPPIANSEVRNGDTYGVLQLTLRAGGYDWRFVPEAGRSFTDQGSGSCH